MKKSAGILLYRYNNGKIEILLCHPGGPYWEGYDNGSWSFAKGEIDDKEKVINCAKREFFEETNLELDGDINYLGSTKVNKKKLVIMFYHKGDYDITNCKSNTFRKETYKGSGIFEEYPEMDKYEWFDINVAKKKIFKNQLYFIRKLEDKLNKEEL